MIVLGLDTTGPHCSVSLVDDTTIRAHIARDIGRGHAEVLAGMVADAFTAAELSPTDVDRLAVCTGPGSFTGLRVALSFAKGFALPRSLPIVGINALEVTAQTQFFGNDQPHVGVYRDIRRNEVFFAVYLRDDAMKQTAPMPISMTNDDMWYYREKAPWSLAESLTIDTRILAWLAIDRDPETHPANPLYSRGPDAKLPGGKSPKKTKA